MFGKKSCLLFPARILNMAEKHSYLLPLFAIMCFLFLSCCLAGPKKYTIKSKYSEKDKGGHFYQIYCDDEFDFKEAGVLKGSFMLSWQTSFTDLGWEIILPQFYSYASGEAQGKYDTFFHMPAALVFEWDGKDGSRKRAEVSLNPDTDDEYTLDGSLCFDYVPLPRNKKIDYTLTYAKGDFLEHPYFKTPIVWDLVRIHGTTGDDISCFETVDKTELLKTDDSLWKGRFVVGEKSRDFWGFPDFSRKPARD